MFVNVSLFRYLSYFSSVFISYFIFNYPIRIVFSQEEYKPGSNLEVSNTINEFEARLQLARALSKINDSQDKAIEEYKFLYSINPDYPGIVNEYSDLLITLRKFDMALQLLNEVAINYEGKNVLPDFNYRLKNVYIGLGRFIEASEIVRVQLNENQNDINLKHELAKLLYWGGKKNESYLIYLELIEKSETNINWSIFADGGEVALSIREYMVANKWYLNSYHQLKDIKPTETEIILNILFGIFLSASWSGDYAEAFKYLKEIQEIKELQDIKNVDVITSAVRTYLAMGEYQDAYKICSYLKILSSDKENFFNLSTLYAEMGDPLQAEFYFGKYNSFLTDNLQKDDLEKLSLFSELRTSWGDFYGAEDLILEVIRIANSDTTNSGVQLQIKFNNILRNIYISTERFEEAAGVFGENINDILLENKARYIDYNRFNDTKNDQSDRNIFTTYSNSNSITDIHKINNPRKLLEISDNLNNRGLLEEALELLENSIKRFPYFLPLKTRYAYLLGSMERYEESINLFNLLSKDLQHNRLILLGRARVYSWSRDYYSAISKYKELRELRPDDSVVHREFARVTSWAKLEDESSGIYNQRFEKSVDIMLLELLNNFRVLPSHIQYHEQYSNLLLSIKQIIKEDIIFSAFEKYGLSDDIYSFYKFDPVIHEEFIRKLKLLRVEYNIQKSFFLERNAKCRKQSLRLIPASRKYQELLAIMPWNQEAWFDLAQVHCSLKMLDKSRDAYKELLDLDPAHNLAARVITDKRINPSLAATGEIKYSREDGRGELSRISRLKSSAGLDYPLTDRTNLHATSDYYVERPFFNKSSLEAEGFTLGSTHKVNPFFTLGGDYSHKNYQDNFRSTSTGHFNILANFWNYADLQLQYKRSDEIYNFFTINERIQADRYSADLKSLITRRIETNARYEYLNYSDSNSGNQVDIGISYLISDHPHILKVSANGQHRHTSQDSQFFFTEEQITSFIHPYWSPRNYYLGFINFQWTHDLSELFLCGTESNFYDLKVIIGNDTDQNALIRFEALWNYEFMNHWNIQINGMMHRSRDWDSEAGILSLKYLF
ncbi:MAG TPA: tetratricopeptide repeat protein [Oligoflexia bacterium]|nr:tetratricopeptide repeat protein [Oligoflexia bacterium]HMP48695.1 tetratricopeptide repeat protein [Oligoflexia bacterium]